MKEMKKTSMRNRRLRMDNNNYNNYSNKKKLPIIQTIVNLIRFEIKTM